MVDISNLEDILGYRFNNKSLLQQALTHRSYGCTNNERMEFVGDGVLDYVIAAYLYIYYPDMPEGDLSKMRAMLVNQKTLAEVAHKIGLGSYLYLGEGEERSGGREKPSILGDCLEAVFAAVALDSSVIQATRVIGNLYHEYLNNAKNMLKKDSKSILQEYCQEHKLNLPEYNFIYKEGHDYSDIFFVECKIAELGIRIAGHGRNKKEASQLAAERTLKYINSKISKIAG